MGLCFCYDFLHFSRDYAIVLQKVVIKIPAMADDKTKQKAIESVADILGTLLLG